MTWVFSALLTWIVLWLINIQLAKIEANRFINLLVPALFGFSILILWEGFVRGFNISPILLPPPSAIAVRFSGSLSILWIDFVQTFIKGALSGYMIGCIAAFITAVAVDKSNFLKRGLLPVGNFVAALPIIGMAPILVMWFGFDWHSKAAVVVVMVLLWLLSSSGTIATISIEACVGRITRVTLPTINIPTSGHIDVDELFIYDD